MSLIKKISHKLGIAKKKDHIVEDKEIRDNKTEKQIDKTINDSFPASDPPSTY